VVVIDSAHNNFHTRSGNFRPFSDLLQSDGYIVKDSEGLYSEFEAELLEGIDILVVANALNDANVDPEDCKGAWGYPHPSAFSDKELSELLSWIKAGGALMLIADHSPFAGGSTTLAEALGVVLGGGLTLYADKLLHFMEFSATEQPLDGLLSPHPILQGRSQETESVTSVVTFNGEAFWSQPKAKVRPLMILGNQATTYYLSTGDNITAESLSKTASVSSYGMLQGATLRLGQGRVAIFGEAAMFSAQLAGPNKNIKMGMNNEHAPGNKQFTLNVLHWLSGLLPEN